MNARTAQTGIVKRFNNARGKGGGYGFIGTPDNGDFFVHISEVRGASEGERALFPGDQVSFEISHGKDGRSCAVNVRVQLRADSHAIQNRHD